MEFTEEDGKEKPANLFRLRVLWKSLEALGISSGAGGRNRTDTEQAPLDFESSASTSFTTPAEELSCFYIDHDRYCQEEIKTQSRQTIVK